MKKYTKIYLAAFKLDESDYIPCEMCGAKAVDIHHIKARGMGGTSKQDSIENLMALCRSCHIKYGDKKHYMKILIDKHFSKLLSNKINFSQDFFV